MKRFARSLITISSLAIGFAAITPAAHAQGPSEEPDATGSATEAVHRGMMKLFDEALSEVSLRPDQLTQIASLKADFKERHAPVRAAKKELMKAVADQVDAGHIDRCALQPQIQALATALQSVRNGDREALSRFHAILTPEQRGQFVDALQKKWEERKEKIHSGKWLDKVSEELGLTPDQRSKIETILKAEHEKREVSPGYAETRETWKKVLEAFRGERFMLEELLPNKDESSKVKRMSECALDTIDAALPILTPEQRALVANKLRGNKAASPSQPSQPSQPEPENE